MMIAETMIMIDEDYDEYYNDDDGDNHPVWLLLPPAWTSASPC